MSRLTRRRFFPIILFIVSLVAAFFAIRMLYGEPQIDRSILSGTPCAIPCWQGITPGVTTYGDALKVLQGNAYVKQGSVEQAGGAASGGATWEWTIPSQRVLPRLTWSDGIVQEITLGLPFELRAQEMIDRFGQPEGLIASPGGQPEAWYWIIDLYYPQLGAEFKAYTAEFANTLGPATEIDVAVLFQKIPLKDRISQEFVKADVIEHRVSLLRTWAGFGDLFEIYYQDQNELFIPTKPR